MRTQDVVYYNYTLNIQICDKVTLKYLVLHYTKHKPLFKFYVKSHGLVYLSFPLISKQLLKNNNKSIINNESRTIAIKKKLIQYFL